MLSLRERLAQGVVDFSEKVVDIPKKSEFLGLITEDGYCDYDVPEEDKSYIEKDNTKAMRMQSSTRARKHRHELRKFRASGNSGH